MESNAKSTASGINEGQSTVHGAICLAETVRDRLLAAAANAEKLASTLDGPVPSDAGTTNAEGSAGPRCMADVLTQTVDGLHSPTTRILLALERIERRLG